MIEKFGLRINFMAAVREIPVDQLPLYEEAGNQSGYEVGFMVEPGQSPADMYKARIRKTDKWEASDFLTMGKRAGIIAIVNEDPSRNHDPFFQALEELKNSAPTPTEQTS